MKPLFALSAAAILLASCSTFVRETPSRYMVFFQRNDAALSAGGRAVVDQAALIARGTHAGSVMIAAGIATDGNLKLAEPRLHAVRQALIADGVGDHIIFRTAISEAGLSVGEPGDQRVEITLVSKSTL